MGNAHYISTLDLAKGYWQVPICHKDERPKEIYKFINLPFGLSRAPAIFQRVLYNVLIGTTDFAGVYLDDIIVYSDIWEKNLEHL
jgi:hypothetical protein